MRLSGYSNPVLAAWCGGVDESRLKPGIFRYWLEARSGE